MKDQEQNTNPINFPIQDYSFTNCKMECAVIAGQKKFNCVPWFLPRGREHNKLEPYLNFNL